MTRLSFDQISRGNDDLDTSSTSTLHLSYRALSDVSCLASFKNLEKLDLSFNCLLSLESLSPCINLKRLLVIENKLESLKGIERLSKLMVFNAGKNKLQKIDEIGCVTNLRALILNDNNISSICKLDQLKYLNTLVLSKNPIYHIGDSLMKAKSLTKLSLSHCHLENIGSSLTSCVDLKELRLAHNKITTISIELAKNSRLRNLDMGNNLIRNWSELKVLSASPNLMNLNLQGNPIAEKDKLANKVKRLVPNLRIFNAKPVEDSNKSKKFFEEDTSDVEAEKGTKRKKSKKYVNPFERNISEKSNEEIHTFPNITDGEVGVKKAKGEKPEKSVSNVTNDTYLGSGKKAKSMEGSNKSKKFYEEDASDVEAAKGMKRKKSKKDMNASARHISEKPNEEIHTFLNLTNDEVGGKQTKRKRSEKGATNVTDDTNLRSGKKAKSRDFENEDFSFMDINDPQALPYDPNLDERTSQNIQREKKGDEVQVIERKKKKKAKSVDPTGLLSILTSNPEVGLGGPSTWDD